VYIVQGQLEQEGLIDSDEKEKLQDETDGELRLSLHSIEPEEWIEDPLKTNRALAALLETERPEDVTPIGVEEVCVIFNCLVRCNFILRKSIRSIQSNGMIIKNIKSLPRKDLLITAVQTKLHRVFMMLYEDCLVYMECYLQLLILLCVICFKP